MMNFYAATLGELLIVEAFVFYIWLKVLLSAVSVKDNTVTGKKLLLTSVGLVVTSIAIFGIMAARSAEYFFQARVMTAVTAFYAALAIGGFLFMVSAAIEHSFKQIKLFFLATGLWTAFYLYMAWFG